MFKFLQKKDDGFFQPFETPKSLAANKSNVPAMWQWILKQNGTPRLVLEGLKEYGTLEGRGDLNNKKIINWAAEIAKANPTPYTNWAADWYNKDSIPWCGLFTALIVTRSAQGDATRMPVKSYLSALAWAAFGNAVDFKDHKNIWMGDIAVFVRTGGGHVATVIGVSSDKKYIVCLGGNQGDAVNIEKVNAANLYAVRRVPYHIKPAGAKNVIIDSNGVPISTKVT